MKIILAIVTLLVPFLAWSQGAGGGGNTGGGLKLRTFQAGCVEGTRGFITAYRNGEPVNVPRVCRDGSYMTDEERAAYIYNPVTYCNEGSYLSSTEVNNGTEENVVRRCQNNKWIKVRSWPKP